MYESSKMVYDQEIGLIVVKLLKPKPSKDIISASSVVSAVYFWSLQSAKPLCPKESGVNI